MKKKHINICLKLTCMVTLFCLHFACRNPVQTTSANQEQNPNGRNDAWGFVGIGGGGAMFNPAVSPFDHDFAFVSCDMTGSFVTENGGKSWRMFNLKGVTKFYAFDPVDSNTVYANSVALFKSTDKGKTWKVVYPTADLFAGFVSKGDHADEKVVTKDSIQHEVNALAIDPGNNAKLYAVISVDKTPAFYNSVDGGLTWKKETELTGRAKNIFIASSSPQNDRTIYITGDYFVLVREKGDWKENKVPAEIGRFNTVTGGFEEGSNKLVLYAISGKSYFNAENNPSGIYCSIDCGKTWDNRQSGLLQYSAAGSATPEWRTIATCLTHPNVVYLSYNNFQIEKDTVAIGVAKSIDFGKTWNLVWKDCLTPKKQFPSPNYNNCWLNERFGPTWGENPFAIGVAPNYPEVCYATDFGRTVKTSNGGKSWEQVYTDKIENFGWSSRGLEVTTSYQMVFDPFDSNHVFICTTDIGLIESNDGGKSWNSATRNNGIPAEWINSTYWLTFDPKIKGKAWAVMSGTHDLPRPKMFRKYGTKFFEGGILETTDGGKSWNVISNEIGQAAFTHILVDPSSDKASRTIYASAFGKGVYKSMDGGKTWIQKNKGIMGDEPFAWRIERRENDGALFLIVSRRSEDESIGDERDGKLYMSVDGAETWTEIKLPAGTNGPTSIIADNNNKGKLLLSAWGRPVGGPFTKDTGGGIFSSDDDGKTWEQVLEEDQHIHDITFDPRTNIFYACGFEGSAYRSANSGKTWERIKGYNFKWGKRVDFDPNNPEKIYIITFGGGVWTGPAMGDSNAIEDIVY